MDSNPVPEGLADAIAVIGMSGRFPRARSVDEFWKNIREGIECVTFFEEEELVRAGADPAAVRHARYVRARACLDDVDLFDAAFFGYTPKEAQAMDPQQRIFLECGFEALENAGYASGAYRGSVGVYAGAGLNTYLLHNFASHPEMFQFVGFDKDFLSTRLSYKLDLRGPSLSVQTACSTSLVAICQACQALLTYQCDIALAGGISVTTPDRSGYFYADGAIYSPDGHCRAFDAQARGIVPGNGAGIVVLKRLQEALADGDRVHAVVRGFAVNNDGAGKIGFTAPSVEGQAQVIAMAHALAGISADTISYVEAHGTATDIGDPIELAALTQAFRATGTKTGTCAIGSVKSNVGHLDAAAGVASFIKTVLAVRDGVLPPTLHFERPNPKIDFANSPFFVNTRAGEFPPQTTPRRAGISSFGLGGTNAHVIIEEAPPQRPSGASRQQQVLTLSARTPAALDRLAGSLASHLHAHSDETLADVAFTLNLGRKTFLHRRAIVCRDVAGAVAALEGTAPGRVSDGAPEDATRGVVFVLPGDASGFATAAAELYWQERAFRDALDECGRISRSELGVDLQTSVFAFEYALSRLWMSWGVHPTAVVGDGTGRHVAACISGAMELRDALRASAADQRDGDREAAWRQIRAEYDRGASVFVEVGAGTWWTDRMRTLLPPDATVVSSLPDVAGDGLASAIAALWVAGVEVDWAAYYASERRLRVELPTYPFERQRFWLDPQPVTLSSKAAALTGIDDWFYQPAWRRSRPAVASSSIDATGPSLVLADARVAQPILERVRERGQAAVAVYPGDAYRRIDERTYEIRPESSDDYAQLAAALAAAGTLPRTIVHSWSLIGGDADGGARTARNLAFYPLMHLAKALAAHRGFESSRVFAITSGACDVVGTERLDPQQASILGLCRVLPQEYPGVRCRTIDLALEPSSGLTRDDIDLLVHELAADLNDVTVAHRAGVRWVQSFEPLRLPAGGRPRIKERGVYLITGGLGAIGLAVAGYLAHNFRARLVLTARRPLPPRSAWAEWAPQTPEDRVVSGRIRSVQALELAGAEVLVAGADVSDEESMRAVIAGAEERFGAVDGVIHAAGVLTAGFGPVRDLHPDACEEHFRPKVDGLLALDRVLRGRSLDFCLLMSSLSAQLGGVGYAAYASANAFMDAFAAVQRRRGTDGWVSVSWDGWNAGVGEAAPIAAGRPALTDRTGIDALTRVLASSDVVHVVVAVGDLRERIEQWVTMPQMRAAAENVGPEVPHQPRPALKNEYVAPATELEGRISRVWREVLGIEPIGATDNFFELGGDSLRGLQVTAKLNRALRVELSPVTLYEAPTVSLLAAFIQQDGRSAAAQPAQERGERRRSVTAATAATSAAAAHPGSGPPATSKEKSSMPLSPSPERIDRSGVAIVGMAGRFPGAPDIETFWRNLKAGVESRTIFTDEELKPLKMPPAALRHPKFVRSGFVLDGVDLFDAAFFGINPREAELLDPQHRLFLECAWEALEHSGYDPETFPGSIGVFGGATLGSYLTNNVFRNSEVVKKVGGRQAIYGSVPDYMVTRVAYKLNLKGPAYFVQSACSTSLVAVHLGCQSLASHECDMVLAGGVSVTVPQRTGYFYEDGGMLSPDGLCRTFDARARGTVFGSGVGMVVLKRLADAIADGDTIHGIIRGAAANNDGSLKVGFTAPGVVGQSRVVAEALGAAGVPAETISYIEAHGTGTELGDPIEVAALTRAYRASTDKRHFCAIGSVKPNIGHLDAAAGVSSLIKTLLALKHEQIPPTINFERPNPKIEFEESPFFVNTELTPWRANGTPRRAGVSSFGFGGTNAHLIIEEAPQHELSQPSRSHQVLVLAARTEQALESATTRLAESLQRQPQPLADVAYTLAVGRRPFAHRRAVVCGEGEDAVEMLQGRDPRRIFTAFAAAKDRPVVFMFPGQGSQYLNMAADLYAAEPLFGRLVDECAEKLKQHLDLDLRDVLYLSTDAAAATEQLTRTSVTQSALFTIEYALARLWMSWGIKPAAMIGHSIGEVVAACLAGVFTLDDALQLVALRGKLMEAMPHGTMAAVPLPSEQVARTLGAGTWLAAANAPSLCVVSGEPDAIDQFVAARAREGVECRRLHTSHAFHSGLMDGAVAAFADAVRKVQRSAPAIPFVSNISGDWITEAEAIDPEYWASHIRQPVRFADGVARVLADADRVLLEVGPGNTLSALVRQQGNAGAQVVVSSLRHPHEHASDAATVAGAVARLWVAGAAVDWTAYYTGERRRRVPLPSYPFERQRFWVEPDDFSFKKTLLGLATMQRDDFSDWFHAMSWKRSPLPERAAAAETDAAPVLLFEDATRAAAPLVARLTSSGRRVVRVRPGSGLERLDEQTWTIAPRVREHYVSLLRELDAAGQLPRAIVHAWTLTGDAPGELDDVAADELLGRGFYSLICLAQAIGDLGLRGPFHIGVVSDGMQEVVGDEPLVAEKATIAGPCRVIPQEFSNVTLRHVDLEVGELGRARDVELDGMLADLLGHPRETFVAYRRGRRWIQTAEALRLDAAPDGPQPRLRDGGTYLITGGFGGIGLVLAEYLAATHKARLVLTGRRALPPRDEWPALEARQGDPATLRRIAAVRRLESLGADVLVGEADSTDEARMRDVVAQARARFGRVDGVIHAAGIAGGGMIQLKKLEVAAAVLAPKVLGTRILGRIFHDQPLDFMLLCSSLAAIVGGVGQVDYCGANSFLDAFARQHYMETGTWTVAVNWNAWREVGMAVDTNVPEDLRDSLKGAMLSAGISNEQGVDAFRRILAHSTERQVALAPNDLALLGIAATLPDDQKVSAAPVSVADEGQQAEAFTSASQAGSHSRPSLQTPYVAPRTDAEERICAVWQDLLGIDRVGVNDNFFELGGHSLLAIRVMGLINERLKTDIPVARLYDGLTVAFLAGLVSPNGHGSAAPDGTDDDETDERRRDRARRQREQQARRRGAMREMTRT